MKYLLIVTLSLLTACGGSTEMLTDIEICLDQGGEWADNQCIYDEKETCLFMSEDSSQCLITG